MIWHFVCVHLCWPIVAFWCSDLYAKLIVKVRERKQTNVEKFIQKLHLLWHNGNSSSSSTAWTVCCYNLRKTFRRTKRIKEQDRRGKKCAKHSRISANITDKVEMLLHAFTQTHTPTVTHSEKTPKAQHIDMMRNESLRTDTDTPMKRESEWEQHREKNMTCEFN